MNFYSSLLLFLCFGLAISAPVLYELDGSFEEEKFEQVARTPDYGDSTGYEVTGSIVTGDMVTDGSDDGTDEEPTSTSGATSGGDDLDGGFDDGTDAIDGETGETDFDITSGDLTGDLTGDISSGDDQGAEDDDEETPAPTPAPAGTTGATSGKGTVQRTVVSMTIDDSDTPYTPGGFTRSMNSAMGITPLDAPSLQILRTSRRALSIGFYFKDGFGDPAALAARLLQMFNDGTLNLPGFRVLGVSAAVEEVEIDDGADADGDDSAASTTGSRITTGSTQVGSSTSGTTVGNAIADEDSGLSDGAIAGIVIGVIILVVVVVGVAMFVLMRKKKNSRVNPA